MRLGSVDRFAIPILIAVQTVVACGQEAKLKVERILTPVAAEREHLGPLCSSIAVTPNGVVVVGDGDRLWAVGADGAVKISAVRNAHSFAISPDGLVVVVAGTKLLYLDPASETLKPIFDLPFAEMRIVTESKDSYLLFGSDGAKGELYELLPGRKAVKVIETPHAITGVARLRDELLIVTDGALFGVYENTLSLLAGEVGGRLRSVAADDPSGRIFLSDGNSIFQIQQGKLMPLAGDLGGELRWQSGGLLVFNPKQRVVARLINLPEIEPTK